jgi:hypothetical protein
MNEQKAQACGCVRPRRAAPSAKPGAATYGLALSLGLAALVPKCPMCLAAYLSLFGLGGGLAAYAYPFLRPLSVLLVALAAGALLFRWARAARGRARVDPRPRRARFSGV